MQRSIRYDLHIHSCLSPCADTAMTPASIAGMAKLQGLDLIALTDHNSGRNLPAFAEAAAFYDIAALFGMELSTAEDIHVVCLFDKAEAALAWDAFVDSRYPKIPNRPAIFGDQYVMDAEDNILDNLPHLLIHASQIGFNEVSRLVFERGGIAFPAHIDKEANSAMAVLGGIPPEAGFSVFEIRDPAQAERLRPQLPPGALFLTDSDSHRPELLGENPASLSLEVGDDGIAHSFLRFLREAGTAKG